MKASDINTIQVVTYALAKHGRITRDEPSQAELDEIRDAVASLFDRERGQSAVASSTLASGWGVEVALPRGAREFALKITDPKGVSASINLGEWLQANGDIHGLRFLRQFVRALGTTERPMPPGQLEGVLLPSGWSFTLTEDLDQEKCCWLGITTPEGHGAMINLGRCRHDSGEKIVIQVLRRMIRELGGKANA